MAKADNMLAILWLLKSRARMTARQLSDELEIHIRTVYRLIDALCMSGVPIVSETRRDGGYHIPPSFKLEPLFFDGEEQGALLHAASFAREAGYPASSALAGAVAKIKRYANPEQLAHMERREAQLEVAQRPADPARQAITAEIGRCIDAQRRLVFRYKSGYDGAGSERTIDPYGLVHWQGRWYAVGYCHLRGAIRSFRVDRMSELQPTTDTFDRPISFSARAHFRLDELRTYTQLPYYLLSFGGKIYIEVPEGLKRHMAEVTEDLHRHYRASLANADSDCQG